jgi:hypothetical protein
MGRLSLKVVPGSSRDKIVGWLGDSLKLKVKAPPEKGRANEAVVALLAERLGIDASSIAVVSGHSGYSKSDRGSADCRMIENSVPVRSSRWLGTGTVTVVLPVFSCITTWLPRCRI